MKSIAMKTRKQAPYARDAASYEVRISDSALQNYKDTIARHPPETFALLGGRLDDPFTITDFRFCPPKMMNGEYDRSAGHVNVDPSYMNFVIDEEFKPVDKYMLGIWHSHPGNSSRPSVGDESRNEGDMVFFRSCLRHDDSPGRNWKHFIAPISTFAPDGSDNINMWVVTLDDPAPARASYTIVPNSSQLTMPNPQTHEALSLGQDILSGGLPLDAIMGRLDMYQTHIDGAWNALGMDPCDREAIVEGLRKMRLRELTDITKGVHPLGQYPDMLGDRQEDGPTDIRKTDFGRLTDCSE